MSDESIRIIEIKKSVYEDNDREGEIIMSQKETTNIIKLKKRLFIR